MKVINNRHDVAKLMVTWLLPLVVFVSCAPQLAPGTIRARFSLKTEVKAKQVLVDERTELKVVAPFEIVVEFILPLCNVIAYNMNNVEVTANENHITIPKEIEYIIPSTAFFNAVSIFKTVSMKINSRNNLAKGEIGISCVNGGSGKLVFSQTK